MENNYYPKGEDIALNNIKSLLDKLSNIHNQEYHYTGFGDMPTMYSLKEEKINRISFLIDELVKTYGSETYLNAINEKSGEIENIIIQIQALWYDDEDGFEEVIGYALSLENLLMNI